MALPDLARPPAERGPGLGLASESEASPGGRSAAVAVQVQIGTRVAARAQPSGCELATVEVAPVPVQQLVAGRYHVGYPGAAVLAAVVGAGPEPGRSRACRPDALPRRPVFDLDDRPPGEVRVDVTVAERAAGARFRVVGNLARAAG